MKYMPFLRSIKNWLFDDHLEERLINARRWPWYLALFFLLVFHLVNNWNYTDNCFIQPYNDDQVEHWAMQIDMQRDLFDLIRNDEVPLGRKIEDLVRQLGRWAGGGNWTALAHHVAIPFVLVFGKGFQSVVSSNAIWMIILFLATFWIGRRLAGPATGFFAVVIMSFYPGLCGASRMLGIDYPLIAMTALCFHLLLSSKELSSIWRMSLLGIATGFGLLANIKLGLFLAGPALVYFIRQVIFNRRNELLIKLLSSGLALAIALVISSVWWWDRLPTLAVYYDFHIASTQDPTSDCIDMRSWQCLTFYLWTSICDMSVIFFGALVLLSPVAFWKARKTDGFFELIAWIVCGLLIFTGLYLKHDRYVFPVHVAFALITALGLAHLPIKNIGRVIIAGLIVILGWMQLNQLSWGASSLPQRLIYMWYRTHDLTTEHIMRDEKSQWVIHYTKTNYNELAEAIVGQIEKETPGDQSVRLIIDGSLPAALIPYYRQHRHYDRLYQFEGTNARSISRKEIHFPFDWVIAPVDDLEMFMTKLGTQNRLDLFEPVWRGWLDLEKIELVLLKRVVSADAGSDEIVEGVNRVGEN